MNEKTEKKHNNIELLIFGIISCILTAYLTVLLENWCDYSFHTLRYKLFISIPIGGFLVGMGTSSGFYFGVKHFNFKMSNITTLVLFILPIVSYILIEYLYFHNLMVDGIRISERISFLKYQELLYTKNNYDLGNLALQIAASSFGGAAIYGFISEVTEQKK